MFVENRSNCFTFIIKWFSKLFNKQNDNSNPNPSPIPDIVIDIKQDVSAINIFDDITQDIIKDTTIEYDYVSPFSHKTCVNSFDDIIILMSSSVIRLAANSIWNSLFSFF